MNNKSILLMALLLCPFLELFNYNAYTKKIDTFLKNNAFIHNYIYQPLQRYTYLKLSGLSLFAISTYMITRYMDKKAEERKHRERKDKITDPKSLIFNNAGDIPTQQDFMYELYANTNKDHVLFSGFLPEKAKKFSQKTVLILDMIYKLINKSEHIKQILQTPLSNRFKNLEIHLEPQTLMVALLKTYYLENNIKKELTLQQNVNKPSYFLNNIFTFYHLEDIKLDDLIKISNWITKVTVDNQVLMAQIRKGLCNQLYEIYTRPFMRLFLQAIDEKSYFCARHSLQPCLPPSKTSGGLMYSMKHPNWLHDICYSYLSDNQQEQKQLLTQFVNLNDELKNFFSALGDNSKSFQELLNLESPKNPQQWAQQYQEHVQQFYLQCIYNAIQNNDDNKIRKIFNKFDNNVQSDLIYQKYQEKTLLEHAENHAQCEKAIKEIQQHLNKNQSIEF